MKRLENEEFFNYLFDMSLLETVEFVFSDDIIIDYRDDMINMRDKTNGYFILWHWYGVICNRC